MQSRPEGEARDDGRTGEASSLRTATIPYSFHTDSV